MAGPAPRGQLDPSLGWLLLALVCAAGALALLWNGTPAPAERADSVLHADASRAAAPAASVAPAQRAAPASQPLPEAAASLARAERPAPAPAADDLAAHVPAGQAPTMGEVIAGLKRAGIHTGLAAFNPPGTRPPLVGLAVPEDFPLPDGYVRHHQATDDGQRIEAILMFAPDREFRDAQGRLIAIPADRVVPPELAPPGLPLRRIVIPAPLDPGRPSP